MRDAEPGLGCSIPVCSIMWIVFAIMKMSGAITWSWWWVFSPIWIPLGLILIFGLFLAVCVLIGTFCYEGENNEKSDELK